MKVFLTGGTGFIGRTILERLANSASIDVVMASRRPVVARERVSIFQVSDLANDRIDWGAGLIDVDVVVHAAARVHIMSDTVADPLEAYRAVNVKATLALAEASAKSGVKRFIFLSSIKVNGEVTEEGEVFSYNALPKPHDPYATSKFEAEVALRELGVRSGMDIVIIRPPLVYGAGVGANFAALMRLVESGLPLPFESCVNKRSLVYVGNLVDLIVVCLDHPGAANQVFMVSDDRDVSISELLKLMIGALGSRSLLFRFPRCLLVMLLTVVGKKKVARRLFGSLCVDIQHTQRQLGWVPPFTIEQGMAEMVCFYYKSRNRDEVNS